MIDIKKSIIEVRLFHYNLGFDIISNEENLLTNKKNVESKKNNSSWENLKYFSGSITFILF